MKRTAIAVLTASLFFSIDAAQADAIPIQSGDLSWYVIPWHLDDDEGILLGPQHVGGPARSRDDAIRATQTYLDQVHRHCAINGTKEAGPPGGWVIQFVCDTPLTTDPKP